MRTLFLCAFMLCAAATLFAAAGAPPAAAPENGIKIAYVDINKVLSQSARRNDMDKELGGIQAAMQEKDRVALDEVNRLAKAVEQLAMGTPERAAVQERLRAAQDALSNSRNESYDKMTKEIVSRMKSLYDDITATVSAVGREGGYDFILKDQGPAPDMTGDADPAMQVSQRVVLYAKPQYDLTSEVVRRLNEAYSARKAGGAAGTDAPSTTSENK